MMATPGDSAAGKEEKARVVLIAMDGSKHSDHAFQCKYCYKMLLILRCCSERQTVSSLI